MEAVALELIRALQAWDRGLVQLPGGEDQRVGLPASPVGAGDRPAPGVLVPATRAHVGVRNDQPVHPLVTRHLLQIAEDLLLGRAELRPVASLRERERVEMAGHIAGAAGIRVVAPGAAEPGPALEDFNVVAPVPAQLDRSRDPAEARSDDHHSHATTSTPTRSPAEASPGFSTESTASIAAIATASWSRSGSRVVSFCSCSPGYITALTHDRWRLRPAHLMISNDRPAISGTPRIRVSIKIHQAGSPIGANRKIAMIITTSRKLVPQRG